MNKPLVSVCCLTYNQEKYISDAIEGFLMQRTSFPVEVIIHDDASTDKTGEIIKGYAERNADLFVPLFQVENQFSKGENPFIKNILPRVSGKYIAFCEGDDYWTDPLKLQKQTDFLESNPNYGMICTNYSRYIQSSGILKRNCFSSAKYGHEVKFADYLLDMSTIGTATVVMRSALARKYVAEIPEDIRDSFVVGDTPLWLFTAARSKVAVLPDETAIYRILDSSACHFISPDEHYKFVLKGFEMADYFYKRYGNNDSHLLERLNRKKLKAALFHGYRSMNRELAKESFNKLTTYRSSLKHRIAAWLMYAGSYNKFLNKTAGILLKANKPGLLQKKS